MRDDPSAWALQLQVFGGTRMRAVALHRLEELTAEFNAVIAPGEQRDLTERATVFDVLDRVTALRELSESPAVRAARDAYFERESHVVASDVNVLVGDSYWHSDGFYEHAAFLRFVVYLEPLSADRGALRILPGSHLPGNRWQGEPTRVVMQHEETLGLSGERVPGAAIESEPGDVVVIDTNVLHAAWLGNLRRQLAFNVVGEPRDAAERADTNRYFLNRYVSGTVRLT